MKPTKIRTKNSTKHLKTTQKPSQNTLQKPQRKQTKQISLSSGPYSAQIKQRVFRCCWWERGFLSWKVQSIAIRTQSNTPSSVMWEKFNGWMKRVRIYLIRGRWFITFCLTAAGLNILLSQRWLPVRRFTCEFAPWVKQSGFTKDARFTISKWEAIEAHMIKWQNRGGNSEDMRWNTTEWQFENMDWKAEEDKAFGQEAWKALRCKEAEETLFRYPYIALALSLCLSSTGKMWQNIAKGS